QAQLPQFPDSVPRKANKCCALETGPGVAGAKGSNPDRVVVICKARESARSRSRRRQALSRWNLGIADRRASQYNSMAGTGNERSCASAQTSTPSVEQAV